jgi:serine/threonine protein kinase
MKRFEREAKAMAQFSHPNIVPVYDFGEVNGSPYLVMEYIPGGTLKERINSPVPYEQAVQWLIPIADALRYAHKRLVIHRDIKPSNILFNEEDRPVLTDFGIAKILETNEATLTGTGLGVGTPEYMAPEQWRGQACETTDQYALGVVLYELITGKKPFSADTPAAVAILQATEPLPRPSTLVDDISESVEKVLFKALANNPVDRYESMASFKKALERVIPGPHAASVKKETEAVRSNPDEPLEKDQPVNPSLSASEIEHADIPSDKIETEGETFDVVDVPQNEDQRKPNKDGNKNRYMEGTNTKNASPKDSSKPDPTKVNKIAIPIAIAVFIILCVVTAIAIIGPLGLYNQLNNTQEPELASDSKTSTAEVRATTTAQAEATAEMKAKKTSTAIAQVTATAQTAMNIYDEYVDTANLVYEKDAGSLEHVDDGKVEVEWTDEDLKDFALGITFTNPYNSSTGDWGYGIMFRHKGSNDQYRLYVTSSNFWYFENWEGSKVSNESGMLNLHMGEGKENKLQLLAIDNKGYFFVNDQFVTELDLAERDYSGSILISIGFINGYEVEGYNTDFKNVVVYSKETSGNGTQPKDNESVQLNLEDEDGMKYIHVTDLSDSMDYRVGPIASSSGYVEGPILSPNGNCLAYLLLPKVYYSKIGDPQILVAGDVSDFVAYQKNGGNFSINWSGSYRIYVDEGLENEHVYFYVPDCY